MITKSYRKMTNSPLEGMFTFKATEIIGSSPITATALWAKLVRVCFRIFNEECACARHRARRFFPANAGWGESGVLYDDLRAVRLTCTYLHGPVLE